MKILKQLYAKLFLSPYFFTIAIRRRSDKSILENPEFKADFVMPVQRKRWVADPILADHEGKTYLFYESVIGDKGRIEVTQVQDDCSVVNSQVILEDECHYSFPFVFQIKNEWYMIPESSASEEVRLYKAAAFPYEWKQVCVLLHQKSVDTTVFCQDGQWYLQTYCLCPGSEQVIPQIYAIEFEREQPKLTKIYWPNYDPLLCRGAGPWFEHDSILYRPAQENEDQRYGNAVRFCRADSIHPVYHESLAGRLTADQVSANMWLDGLHTYTVSQKFEAIDIRIRKFDATKLLRVAISKLNRL